MNLKKLESEGTQKSEKKQGTRGTRCLSNFGPPKSHGHPMGIIPQALSKNVGLTVSTQVKLRWYIYILDIRRPRPLPRQGRRLGPPEVWNLALGSQAKAHAIKATPLSATCPSHLHAPAELLHLHAPAICFSGRSRLPFARPQTLQTLPQASKATTLTATTCPCHLFFRGFKTLPSSHWSVSCRS